MNNEVLCKLMEAALQETVQPGDHFMIDPNCSVWYSRYYKGGSFESVCGFFSWDDMILTLARRCSKGSEAADFDIAAPDSLKKIGLQIREWTKEMQPDRKGMIFSDSSIYLKPKENR